tara:strand:- start:154 stop:402 length:249 start_codon:yes stop_codon:yes gene_type:complete
MSKEILFFSAPWCGPCSQIKMQLTKDIINKNNIKIIDISEEESQKFVINNKVMNVPTFIKIVDGKEVNRKVGSITISGIENL